MNRKHGSKELCDTPSRISNLLRTKFDLILGPCSKFWKSSKKAPSYSFTVKLLDYFSLFVRYLLKVYCHEQ